MTPLFTSSRLIFREFTLQDAPLIYELNNAPGVTKYVHEPATTPENVQEILANIILPQYQKYHHGRWALHLKDSLEFIGWCGLKRVPERNFPDLGYRLFPKYWGKGYATEAAKKTVEYGFEVLQLDCIFGAAHEKNIASQKILEKCGLSFLAFEIIDGVNIKTYQLINQKVFSTINISEGFRK